MSFVKSVVSALYGHKHGMAQLAERVVLEAFEEGAANAINKIAADIQNGDIQVSEQPPTAWPVPAIEPPVIDAPMATVVCPLPAPKLAPKATKAKEPAKGKGGRKKSVTVV